MSDPAAACGPLGNEASHALRELAAQKEKEWREVQDLRLAFSLFRITTSQREKPSYRKLSEI